MKKILIIEDDAQMRFFLEQALQGEPYGVAFSDNAESGLALMKGDCYDVVLTDVRLPGMDGVEAVQEIKKINPHCVVLVMTAYNTRDVALEAVRKGAYDFFAKPFKVAELRTVIGRAMERVDLLREIHQLREKLASRSSFGSLVGKSPQFLKMLRSAERIAPTDSTVLIVGESGTGKELIAQSIHENSRRSDKPIIKLNCAAIPGPLLESELFGYKKGAFTNALTDKDGKFQAADGGTIFLDEIGDLDLKLQGKVLRALEQHEVERVGSAVPEKVDVRIIAATNQSLAKLREQGKFREDLFYRLAVFQLRAPSLRDRPEDVQVLAWHFMKNYSAALNKPLNAISDPAMAALAAYKWPGNVRELRNTMEVAAVMTEDDVIGLEDLPGTLQDSRADSAGDSQDRVPLDRLVERFERQVIIDALRQVNGVQAEAAKKLGISERSMWHRVKKYAIDARSLKSTSA